LIHNFIFEKKKVSLCANFVYVKSVDLTSEFQTF